MSLLVQIFWSFAIYVCTLPSFANATQLHLPPDTSTRLTANFSTFGTARGLQRASPTNSNLIQNTTESSLSLAPKSTPLNTCTYENQNCTSHAFPTSMANDSHITHRNGSEWCSIWDGSCTGNQSLALDDIYKTNMWPAMVCVRNRDEQSCEAGGHLGGLKYVRGLESWMRSPKCLSTSSIWATKKHQTFVPLPLDMESDSCCGACRSLGSHVDLFYWPVPNADDSCMSIVGSTVNAIDAGATTTSYRFWNGNFTTTYWGCHARAFTSDSSIITTAFLSTIKSMTFKVSLANPWDPPDCIDLSTPGLPSVAPNTALNPRLISDSTLSSSQLPPLVTQRPQSQPVTAVLEGYTFTSPYVYARFYNVTAGDWCGSVGTSETMLSFAPGELSTIDGHLLDRLFYPGRQPSQTNTMIKPFNPADLPCPPRSVMENHWYKPAPGEPYRPLIAAPKQFSSWNKLFASCKPSDFTAIDPPRLLIPEQSMLAGSPSAAQPASIDASVTIDSGTFSPPTPLSPAPALDGGATETNSPNLVPPPSKQNDPQREDGQPPPADSNKSDQAHGSGGPAAHDDGAPVSGIGYHIIQQLSGTSPDSDRPNDGVIIDGKTVRPGSTPVSVSGVSQALVVDDGTGRDLIIGDHILPMSPPHLSDDEDARVAPVVTTLLAANGERAVMSWPPKSSREGNKNEKARLSIYGTVLTAGGSAITVATGTAADGHPILATLSLDSQMDLIYNPTVRPLKTLANPSLKQTGEGKTLAYGKDRPTTAAPTTIASYIIDDISDDESSKAANNYNNNATTTSATSADPDSFTGASMPPLLRSSVSRALQATLLAVWSIVIVLTY